MVSSAKCGLDAAFGRFVLAVDALGADAKRDFDTATDPLDAPGCRDAS